MDEAIIVTGEDNIRYVRLLALRGAVKMEVLGLRRRGKSARSILAAELGLPARTPAKKVLAALDEALGR